MLRGLSIAVFGFPTSKAFPIFRQPIAGHTFRCISSSKHAVLRWVAELSSPRHLAYPQNFDQFDLRP